MPPIPNVQILKADGQTGSVAPSPVGVLTIIAPANAGPVNVPAAYMRDDLAFATFGPSPLVEEASYTMAQSGNPVNLVRPTTSNAAAYGAVVHSGVLGTAIPSAGATAPADNYPVVIRIVNPGTVGTTGITYQYSLDGGIDWSGTVALGTATTLTIPNFPQGGSPGVSFALAAGTLLAGDTWSCPTTHATTSNADLATSLEAVRVSTLPYEGILIDQDVATGTVSLCDTWLAAQEKIGKFRFIALNTALKGIATEAAYATAMATLVASLAPSIRCVVGADGGNVTSTLTGLTLPRPASLALAADAMAIPMGQDPAWVGAGAIGGYVIVDANGNPSFHNEELYPNLDQLLLTTLRSVNGNLGVYITNARIFSQVGSDYVFLPQVRTMNRACEIAYAIMTQQLGRAVGKKPPNPDGTVNMLDDDRLTIDGLVNGALESPMKGQVAGYQFALNASDDLSANSGGQVTASLAISSLVYIKGVKIVAGFVKSISVAL